MLRRNFETLQLIDDRLLVYTRMGIVRKAQIVPMVQIVRMVGKMAMRAMSITRLDEMGMMVMTITGLEATSLRMIIVMIDFMRR